MDIVVSDLVCKVALILKCERKLDAIYYMCKTITFDITIFKQLFQRLLKFICLRKFSKKSKLSVRFHLVT